ncbi:nucleoid-associated protein [Clostridiaceae bacterium UIB06]|uniref:Nucleoid-associated protein n=1 Tax=Clostridium thailandense TaxID=2794346 RepID=A0A949WQ30_9CLOT|nr:nucleoid-associated protein [Clostridium thailandense]MBV7272165.1 nucleoid-associated protein [Clostridium thailandense]MCH5135982.1 nucleoid-associated protein [Clostridiaceae bacterium UIB06]
MEYIKEIIINEAVVHILDTNAEEPVLNEYPLQLNEEIYGFLLKHIERCLKDEELRYAIFNGEKNVIKEASQEYLNEIKGIIETSKELANKMFRLMKAEGNIYSCDLVIVSISTEYGPMLAILKMDYIKNYTHSIEFLDNKIGINIVPELTGLPTSSGKIQKSAFIKVVKEDQGFNLMIIDKQSKSKDNMEYGSDYFTNKYLGCRTIDNERDMTKTFVKAAEEWTRTSFEENADTAEIVRSSIKKKLKEEEKIDVHSLAEDMFGDNVEIQQSFKEYISSQGVGDNVDIDKQWVEKKLKRVRLKIDKEIDLYINQDAYYDNSKFEIQRVGDGSINIVIKHVRNYTEK